MKTTKLILTVFLALILIAGGVNHFLKPEMYLPFIPTGLPGLFIIYISGVVEIVVGVGALIPRTKSWATLGILLLMIFFLPLHVIDVFKDSPAIGTHQTALIRLPIQFVLIAWAWFIHKKNRTGSNRPAGSDTLYRISANWTWVYVLAFPFQHTCFGT